MSRVIWITGVSGAGKTTLAEEIAETLYLSSAGEDNVIVLDADEVRKLWPEVGMSRGDRMQNVMRIARLALMLERELSTSTGVTIIIACIAPDRDIREAAMRLLRTRMECIEIYLYSPLETRIERDHKGLYRKAIEGKIKGLTGYDGEYDRPLNPQMSFDTSKLSAVEIALKIAKELL